MSVHRVPVLHCLAVFSVLTVLPAAAQVNTGTIDVLVMNATNQPLGAVEVRVTSSDSGVTLRTSTAIDGTARLSAIPPGRYDVEFTLQGFAPLRQEGVIVRVGQSVVLHATLQTTLTETVVVVGRASIVDVRRTDSSTNIVPEQIEALPVADRDFQRLAFIAPSVQRERGEFRFVTGGPVIGAAGNASQSTLLVDGADFTDPALGLAITRFSQDAIREFRVISNRFDSEVGGSAGGALSIVTRSGTNVVAGTGFAFFRNDALRARQPLSQGKVPYARQQFGATVGGPLVRNRTHVFGSFEQINEDNVTLFRPGGAFASTASDVEVPFNQSLVLTRVDHQVSASTRIAGKLAYERYRQDNFRVGGIQDVSYGQDLNRDNWSFSGEHVWAGTRQINQLSFLAGQRRYDEPRNSTAVAEWFSNGNTLRAGGNILGDLLGDGSSYQVQNTFIAERGAHQIKAGAEVHYARERSRIDGFQSGLFIYLTDTRALPLAYAYGTGSSDITISTTRYAAYLQDDWLLSPNLTVKMGVRYDLDTNGNNPDFQHPLVPNGREVDRNNFQPRVSFSWDPSGSGNNVLRGGAGRFTGRYLLVPAIAELQQNGVTGRVLRMRVNGLALGLPGFALDPANPETTGVALRPDISLIDDVLDAPNSTQVSGGWTTRLAGGLYLDTEGVYVRGRDEIIIRDTNFGGNANPVRLNRDYGQINTYTNEGRSAYKALIVSLNGTLARGHLVTASYTLASKENTADDFSPEFPTGYPSDPSNVAAEYGNSRTDERHRLILTGVFRLPFEMFVSGIYEYGSGQPWTHRLGYDFNGDGKNSDRPADVRRFTEDGPTFNQLSLRVSKTVHLTGTRLELIAEAFNLFDTTNFDVVSVDGAEFLSGPTLASPSAPFVPNPNFRAYRAALPSREIQLGVRWSF